MTPDTADIEALGKRVERLEGQNRRLKTAAVAVLAALGTLMLMGQAPPPTRVVKANGFVLVNSEGKIGAKLELRGSTGQPTLTFYDSKGALGATLTNEGLMLLGSSGAHAPIAEDIGGARLLAAPVVATVTAEGLTMQRGSFNGPPVASLLVNHDGSPLLDLTDAAGFSTDIGSTDLTTPASGETHHTSAASIVMFGNGKDHKVIWRAPENP